MTATPQGMDYAGLVEELRCTSAHQLWLAEADRVEGIMRRAADAITALTASRDDVLEEAARICERIHREMPNNAPGFEQNLVGLGCSESAKAIRSLKSASRDVNEPVADATLKKGDKE